MTTDEKLRRLEARLQNLYRDAEKEMRGKWDEYMSRQEKKAERLRARILQAKTPADKLAAEAAYRDHLNAVTSGSAHFRDMVRSLAANYANANQRALAIINGKRSEFFADGYNLSAGEINGAAIDADVGIRFDLVDASTIEWLVERTVDEPEKVIMPPPEKLEISEDKRWSAKLIQSQVAQGIAQGESIPKIAKRLEKVTDNEAAACIRRARTMVTDCENAGRVRSMKQAEEMGVRTRKQWVCTHDDRTRDTHLQLDGETIDIDATFWNKCRWPGDHLGPPAEVWNCFVGETNIATDCEIVRSYKHEYSGKLITIKTASGINFSCTTNHPILTPRGWVAAESLNRGDDLLIASICDNGASGIKPYIDKAFPRIDAIHDLFDKLGGKRTCALGVNFHGDVATSEVEIITKKGLLWNNGNSGALDNVDKITLEHSDALAFGFGHPVTRLRRIHISALGFVGRICKALPFFRRHLRHAVVHGFGTIPEGDSTVLQPKTDGVSGDLQFLSKRFDGLPGKILRDNIIDIKITTVSHIPVYNLQTGNGYYFVNNIVPQNRRKVNGNFAIAHNCRCTLVTVVDGFDSTLPRGKQGAIRVRFGGEEEE